MQQSTRARIRIIPDRNGNASDFLLPEKQGAGTLENDCPPYRTMIIETCGQKTAVRLVAEVTERISVISITAAEEENVIFPGNENTAAFLRLRFNDLTELPV